MAESMAQVLIEQGIEQGCAKPPWKIYSQYLQHGSLKMTYIT